MKFLVEFDSLEEANTVLGRGTEVTVPGVVLQNKDLRAMALAVDPQEDGSLLVQVSLFDPRAHENVPGVHKLVTNETVKLT